MEEKSRAEVLGNIIGNVFGIIITLGVISGILFLCWNYGLHEVVDVDKIKYYQSFLFIIGWRSLTYTPGK